MRKFLTSITLILLLPFTSHQLNAQVVTGIDDFRMCYGASASMPVVVQNMNNVTAFRLAMSYDKTIVQFVEYFAVNPKLSGGTFELRETNDSLIMSWSRSAVATLTKDTLVWLKFKGYTGSTTLKWNAAGSYFLTPTGSTLALFTNTNVKINKKLGVLLTELDPTCASKNDANYMANASGGFGPYSYKWNGKPGRFDSIQSNMYSGINSINITDSWGCKLDSIFNIKGLPGAKVKVIVEGNQDTTIYLQNPVLTFSFQEIAPTHVVQVPLWDFGDGDTAREFKPTHVFSKAITSTEKYYTVKLHISNENGCDTIIETRIPIKEAKLKIPGVITPNGDSFNESFMILNENKTGSAENIKVTTEYQRMELVVFDRWGRKVYEDSNYQNDWRAEGASDGSYYFKLKTVGFYRTDSYKGSITVLGSGKF